LPYLNKILLALTLTALTGCSTLSVNSNFNQAQDVVKDKVYQLRVQTRDETMDKLVYNFAFREFGKYISISETGPYSGTIDVLLFKTSEYSFLGPRSIFSTVTGYADMWYTNGGYTGKDNNIYTIGEDKGYNEEFSWQNTTVLVTIRDNDRKKLWAGEYIYRFDTETPQWFVNTASEIAETCIKRIGVRMRHDLRIKRPPVVATRNYRERDKVR
jgi:hypothetical protein